MVRSGEYLERMVVVPRGPLALEALYHRGSRRPPVALAAPHPAWGGAMESPVVAEVAWALSRAGHATLRFNYRGVGASGGDWDGGRHDADDLDAVATQLAETESRPAVALFGYSYGALVAARLAARRVPPALVLASPAVTALDFAPALEALAALPAPPKVLVVSGEGDALAPPERLAAVLATLGPSVRWERVPGADHAWSRGLARLGRAVAEFVGAVGGGAVSPPTTAR